MLGLRLKAIAALVPFGARACDIGTDHARLPIFLMQSGRASAVLATDINEKPLRFAEENIRKSAVGGIRLIRCDGVPESDAEREEIDTVIIAGIGGEVISGIISRSHFLCGEKAPLLILQPTTSGELLRCYLCENGFEITSETPVSENGKHYSVMTARFCGQCRRMDDAFYYTGHITAETESGKCYIEKQYRRVTECAEALKSVAGMERELEKYSALSEKIGSLLKK